MTAIRIPGLIDVLSVDDAEDIAQLAEHPALDRVPDGGPLVVRLLRRRVANTLRSPDGPLPSALPKDNAERLELRETLFAQLADPDLPARLEDPIDAAARFVRGGAGAPGPLAQTLFGRVFVADFTATSDSWSAAEVIGRAVGPPKPRSIWESISGRRTLAQIALSRAMHGDRNGVHAIGIAVHNFVPALLRMQSMDISTPTDEVLAAALLAPERVARSGISPAETVGGRIRKSTFVILNTRKAGVRTLDPRIIFLRDAWSGCPAHAFVPDLVRRIWNAAKGLSR